MKTFFPKSKHLIINVLLRKQLKTTYVRQFELRIYTHTHIHTPTHAILLLLKKVPPSGLRIVCKSVHAGNHFIRQLLEIKRRGYASVLSVAAPFDSVTDADVLGAEDVVDVGIADVYDAFEVIFVGDIDGG